MPEDHREIMLQMIYQELQALEGDNSENAKRRREVLLKAKEREMNG
jgi:hypothetical protein